MRPAKTAPGLQPVRCGAKTRSGGPCKLAPVTGQPRCRMHGAADGSGAPKGERNGNCTAAIPRRRRQASVVMRGYSYAPGAELRP
jgi:hypothetical protein